MAGSQGSCGWPGVREITATMLLSWLYPSLEGRKRRSRFPLLPIGLPVQEDAGIHLNFYPTTTFCCWLGKIQVCFSIILCPKSSGSFPKCWSPPESSDGCANPLLAASPGIPGDLRCPERAVGSSPWLLGVSWCRLMIDSAILPRCFGRCLPPSLAAPAGNKH